MSGRRRIARIWCLELLVSLLTFCLLFTSVTGGEVLFPVEGLQGDFVPSSLDFIRPNESIRQDRSVIHSFNPADPSPTLAAVQPFGVSQVRFVESDAIVHNPLAEQTDSSSLVQTTHEETAESDESETAARFLPAPLPVIPVLPSSDPVEDRWPWPALSRPNRQNSGRQLSRPAPIAIEEPAQVTGQSLIVKKVVPKPYRILTQVSSCPKLYHDLKISCHLSQKQQQGQPVLFQWRKTVYNQNADALIKNRVLDSPVKLAIAFGNHLQTKDPRYEVETNFESTTLTIKQLKVADCGSYTCEASSVNGTVIASSDLMIFLCF